MSSSVNDRLMEDITSIKNGGSINDEIGGRIIISSSVNDRLMEDITSIENGGAITRLPADANLNQSKSIQKIKKKRNNRHVMQNTERTNFFKHDPCRIFECFIICLTVILLMFTMIAYTPPTKDPYPIDYIMNATNVTVNYPIDYIANVTNITANPA